MYSTITGQTQAHRTLRHLDYDISERLTIQQSSTEYSGARPWSGPAPSHNTSLQGHNRVAQCGRNSHTGSTFWYFQDSTPMLPGISSRIMPCLLWNTNLYTILKHNSWLESTCKHKCCLDRRGPWFCTLDPLKPPLEQLVIATDILKPRFLNVSMHPTVTSQRMASCNTKEGFNRR